VNSQLTHFEWFADGFFSFFGRCMHKNEIIALIAYMVDRLISIRAVSSSMNTLYLKTLSIQPIANINNYHIVMFVHLNW
jgi:hypothetical protein